MLIEVAVADPCGVYEACTAKPSTNDGKCKYMLFPRLAAALLRVLSADT